MKTMKLLSSLTFLLLLILVVSCNDTKKNTEVKSSVAEAEHVTTPTTEKVASSNILCKVNGKEWEYTEASGIISNERKYGRIAFVTFKKKLEKGSESIQLRYKDETKELISVLIQLKKPKKDGGLLNATYQYSLDPRDNKYDVEISGVIDLTNPTQASGTGEIIDLPIKFEKKMLLNPDDGQVSITDLQFSGIGYSDLDKSFGN